MSGVFKDKTINVDIKNNENHVKSLNIIIQAIFRQHKAAILLSSAWFQRPDHNLLTKPWTHWMDCRASPIMSCERTRHSLHSWDFQKVTIAKVQLKKYLHFQLSTNSHTSAMQFMSYLRRSAPEKIRRNNMLLSRPRGPKLFKHLYRKILTRKPRASSFWKQSKQLNQEWSIWPESTLRFCWILLWCCGWTIMVWRYLFVAMFRDIKSVNLWKTHEKTVDFSSQTPLSWTIRSAVFSSCTPGSLSSLAKLLNKHNRLWHQDTRFE